MSIEEFVPLDEEKIVTSEGVSNLNRVLQGITDNINSIKPIFHVNKNGTNQTGIVSGVLTKLTWSTEVLDTNLNFASSKFTPTIPGKYLLIASARFNTGLADGTACIISLYKNGAEFLRGSQLGVYNGAGTNAVTINGSFIVESNGSTDYFEVYVYHDSGSDEVIDGIVLLTFFQGFRITE